MRTLARLASERTTKRSWATDFVLAVLVGLVAALAKKYLDFHLGVPGHAGVGWIAALICGSLVNPRRGMAVVAGLSMGLWSAPVGLDHTLGYNVALYTSVAGVLELSLLTRVPVRRLLGAAAVGAAVHVAKYVFVFVRAWVDGIVRNVEIYGLVEALRNHLAFGIAGGMVGWGLLAAGRWAAHRYRTVRS